MCTEIGLLIHKLINVVQEGQQSRIPAEYGIDIVDQVDLTI